MKAKHENPFDTLAELELTSPSESDLISEKEIFADLRFSDDQIDVGGYDICVSLAKATLHIHAWGSHISPGTRLAEQSKLSRSHTETRRKMAAIKKATGENKSIGANTLGFAQGNIGTDAHEEHGEEIEIEIIQEINYHYVRATSGNRWIICEGSNDNGDVPLNDTYIANDLLCKIKPNENANSVSVDGMVVVRKSDFSVEVTGSKLQREYRDRLHRNKFHKAIIAKCLSEYTGQTDNEQSRGRLIVSRSTLETDPDVS
jgi:hypothetical protein